MGEGQNVLLSSKDAGLSLLGFCAWPTSVTELTWNAAYRLCRLGIQFLQQSLVRPRPDLSAKPTDVSPAIALGIVPPRSASRPFFIGVLYGVPALQYV
jgi:hypothetical protein